MNRGATGRFHRTSTAGEVVHAFIPRPLPPDPVLTIDGNLQVALEQALLALGRLDSITALLPDPDIFLYSYVRKEAILSSQIEGTQSSLSDLLLFEMKEAPGAPLNDVREVSNYVAAMEHGLKCLRGGFPLSNRLLREIHGILLSHGRGGDKAPGQFRTSQNWIGGTRPGTALFVPPPHQEVQACMAALESFLHDDKVSLPILVKAGLAHVQFETIHPFLDGNGRVGRLLITLFLCDSGVLKEPTLYLSLYFKQKRSEYYRLLEEVRKTGDWETWMAFFLKGVRQTADGAVATARRLAEMFLKDRDRIREGGRAAGSALRVHDVLKERPLLGLQSVARRAHLSFPTSASGMKLLLDLKIARELTGKRRNRIFGYDRYLKILGEGMEPL